MKYYPWIWMVLLGSLGCQPAVAPNFDLSEEVLALGADAEDDEEKQLWQGLRDQIEAELTKYCGTPRRPKLLVGASQEVSSKEAAQLKTGAAIYMKRCQSCHGVSGDGNGPVAQYLEPRPRDYRKGIFKFTSMPYGSKPRRSDLIRTVQRGVTGTSMPSFDELPPEEIDAVVDYVLALTHRGEFEQELALLAEDEEEVDSEYVEEIIEIVLDRWKTSNDQVVMPDNSMPPMTPESVAEGHRLFLKQACNKCHGKNGRGGSVGNVDVGKDAWGNKAAAADLTSGMFRGGERPLDIYRRISAGINGTPMPAFGDSFRDDPNAVWHLAHFIIDTGQRRRRGLAPLNEAEIQSIEQAQTSAEVVDSGNATTPFDEPVNEISEPEENESETPEAENLIEKEAA